MVCVLTQRGQGESCGNAVGVDDFVGGACAQRVAIGADAGGVGICAFDLVPVQQLDGAAASHISGGTVVGVVRLVAHSEGGHAPLVGDVGVEGELQLDVLAGLVGVAVQRPGGYCQVREPGNCHIGEYPHGHIDRQISPAICCIRTVASRPNGPARQAPGIRSR